MVYLIPLGIKCVLMHLKALGFEKLYRLRN